MADALTLFAVQRGMQAGAGIGDAFKQQAYAALKSDMMQRQMDEIETRTKMQIENIYKQAEKVQSHQVAAFISGGVTLSGSAMSVVSDTMADAAQAAYIRQRESDYDVSSLMIEKSQYDAAASSETLMLNIAASSIGAYASFKGDEYRYGRKSLRDVGPAQGIS